MALGFQHPFTCVLAGPTQCGKTVWVQKLLKGLSTYVIPPPERIVWVYGVNNEKQFNTIKSIVAPSEVEFLENIPSTDMFSPEENNLLIIDDMMGVAGKSKSVADLFTKGCHHRNISVILILQNLFHQGSKMRDIHTSTNYLVLFKNPRDCSHLSYVQRQCFPNHKRFLFEAYKDACSKPYGYLLFDFHQESPEYSRVSTGIFPPQIPIVYEPRDENV